jgi:hypothetical protein
LPWMRLPVLARGLDALRPTAPRPRVTTSRHGDPVRARQRIPPISRRRLCSGGRPGRFPAGSSGSSTRRSSPARSCRPAADRAGTRPPVFRCQPGRWHLYRRPHHATGYILTPTPSRDTDPASTFLNTALAATGATSKRPKLRAATARTLLSGQHRLVWGVLDRLVHVGSG